MQRWNSRKRIENQASSLLAWTPKKKALGTFPGTSPSLQCYPGNGRLERNTSGKKPASSLIPQATLALVCGRFCSLEQAPLHPRKLGERVKDCLFHKDPSQGQEIQNSAGTLRPSIQAGRAALTIGPLSPAHPWASSPTGTS